MYRNFNLYDYCSQLLPPLLRRPVLMAFLRALLRPVDDILQRYKDSTDEANARVSYTAFTAHMEKHLNDLLGTEGVYIRDWMIEQTIYLAFKEENSAPDYLAFKEENQTVVYISNDRRLLGGFEVMVPSDIATEQNLQMVHDHVQRYKFAGKKYKVTIY